jgi:hypothetical protein
VETLGYWFLKGRKFVCSACWRSGGGYPVQLKGQGYAIPIYQPGREHRVRGRCELCDLKIDGEVMKMGLPEGIFNPSEPGQSRVNPG